MISTHTIRCVSAGLVALGVFLATGAKIYPEEVERTSIRKADRGSTAGEPDRADRNGLYLQLLGRNASLWSLHLEIAPWKDLALESGVGYIDIDRYKGLHFDMGLSYWMWSSGPSALVLGLSLSVDGAVDPVGDHYCSDEPGVVDCEPYFYWGLGLGGAVFYEYREGILLRVGLTPTWWVFSQSSLVSCQFEEPLCLLRLVALEVGWSF